MGRGRPRRGQLGVGLLLTSSRGMMLVLRWQTRLTVSWSRTAHPDFVLHGTRSCWHRRSPSGYAGVQGCYLHAYAVSSAGASVPPLVPVAKRYRTSRKHPCSANSHGPAPPHRLAHLQPCRPEALQQLRSRLQPPSTATCSRWVSPRLPASVPTVPWVTPLKVHATYLPQQLLPCHCHGGSVAPDTGQALGRGGGGPGLPCIGDDGPG